MLLYNRNLQVRFFKDKGSAIAVSLPVYQIEGLHIQFEFTASMEGDLNKGTITIYNMNEDHRKMLAFSKSVQFVQLWAGYGVVGSLTNPPLLKQIFEGDILSAPTVKTDTDYVTTVNVGDGGFAYESSYALISVPEGTQLLQLFLLAFDALQRSNGGKYIKLSPEIAMHVAKVAIQGTTSDENPFGKSTKNSGAVVINEGITKAQSTAIKEAQNLDQMKEQYQPAMKFKGRVPVGPKPVPKFAFNGATKELINQLCKKYFLCWSIRNGIIEVFDLREIRTLPPIEISSQTGMIGTVNYLERGDIGCKKLLDPDIIPWGSILVFANNLTEQYYLRVGSVKYYGDNRDGDWFTEVTSATPFPITASAFLEKYGAL